jgi:negative regulator of flagellin synthesis FlgM
MKVNNSGAKPTSSAVINSKDLEKTLGTKGKGEASATSASGSTMGSSKINMSPEAQAFQKAKAIASEDSVDEAKVARLQKLIDQGKYKVDAEAIADRLVDEHLMAGE